MSNHAISFTDNQAKLHHFLNTAAHLGARIAGNFVPDDLSIKINDIKHNVNITPLRMKMINFVLRFIINCKGGAFPSHTTIAIAVKCKRDAVLQAFKVFEALHMFNVQRRIGIKIIDGLVTKQKMSNVYTLGAAFMNGTVVQYLSDIIPSLQVAYYRCKFGVASSQSRTSRTFERNHTLTTNVGNYVNNSSTILVNIIRKKLSLEERAHWLTTELGKKWRNMITWIENDPTVSRENFNIQTFEYKTADKKNFKKDLKEINTKPKVAPPVVPLYSHKEIVQTETHNRWQTYFADFIPADKR